jgi:8-oxo-dGTP pyrophosphatase MutT (NUDIX family)
VNVIANWQILDSSYSFTCPWLKVRKDVVLLPNGVEIPDFYITETPNWVNIIAITTEGKFIMEEQYRHGIQKVCFELCAGMVDEGESPIDAAKRELLEETGFSCGNWMDFGMSVPNASGSTTKCYHFLATDVLFRNKPKPEATEDIKIHLLTEQEVIKLMHDGHITEAVMLAPLWRYFANK